MTSKRRAVHSSARTAKARIAHPATDAAAIVRVNRDAEFVALRAEGLSLSQIAEKFEVNKTTVLRGIRRVLASVVAPAADEMRVKHLERLETLIEAWWDKAHGESEQAGALVLKAYAAEADLFGLNAPKETRVTGKDGEPLVPTVAVLNGEERMALLEAVRAERARRVFSPSEAADDSVREPL